MDAENKINVLEKYLIEIGKLPNKELSIQQLKDDENIFRAPNGGEYLVLNCNEAYELAKQDVMNSFWKLDVDFIFREYILEDGEDTDEEIDDIKECLSHLQNTLGAKSNAFIRALFGGRHKDASFLNMAISYYIPDIKYRGKFAGKYVFKNFYEAKKAYFYIYRLN